MESFSVSDLHDVSTALRTEMSSGESLLWSGQPQQKVIFHQRDWFAIPFSLAWGGFAIIWEFGVTGFWGNSKHSQSAPGFLVLWGIPFIIIGQYMIWGRFLYVGWKKARTYYGVTNKRVLVLNTGSNRRVTDAYFSSINSVSLTTRPDGVGTIEFVPEPDAKSSWGLKTKRGQGNQIGIDLSRLAFFDINDARTVYQLIQSQRDKAQP